MWQVNNEVNKTVLISYGVLISSFFRLAIQISKQSNKSTLLADGDFLSNEFKKTAYLDARLLTINISAQDQIKPLIEEIVCLNTTILKEQFEIYKYQNKEVSNKNYNLVQLQHPDCLKKIFKDYFYTKFFGIDWIWSELIETEYTRSMFKTNFKEENKLYVCSYCDTDTISNARNAWIEHFLPKSKFPFISCNPFNLIPSCTACNVAGSGKGENIKNPIVSQYNRQIGDYLEFEYEDGEILIKNNTDDNIENFIELLKLRNRYKEESVNSRILSTLKINYSNALGQKNKNDFNKDIFFDFLHDMGRNNGLYFVQKDLLKYIDEI